jgi:hypothetical protein
LLHLMLRLSEPGTGEIGVAVAVDALEHLPLRQNFSSFTLASNDGLKSVAVIVHAVSLAAGCLTAAASLTHRAPSPSPGCSPE